MSGVLVRTASALAVAGTVHAAVNSSQLRRPSRRQAPLAVDVSVLIPARDEAVRIGGCLDSVLAQHHLGRIEVIVLDDGSGDDTRRIAATYPGVRVVAGAPLPDGWLGKPHACAQLAELARASSTVFIFLDADVRLEPHAVAAAVELMQSTGLDLTSPYPRQVAVSVAERLVQPLLQWSWLTMLPLRAAETSRRPSLAAANGQFLLVRRTAYLRAGGHATVRRAVLEDMALARAVNRTGGRGAVVDGTHLASCRMYYGWRELRDGYGKSLWAAFGSAPAAVGAVAALLVTYVLPPLAALRGSRAGALGYGAGVAGRVVTARRTGARAWPDALAHPLSIGGLAVLTAQSLIGARRGSLRWRGRPVRVSG